MTIILHGCGRRTIQEYPQPVSLSTVLQESGVSLDFPCGGKGRCGKCRVLVRGEASPPTPQELALLTPAQREAGIRLACMTTILGDAEVVLPSQEEQQILTEGQAAAFQPDSGEAGYGIAVDIGTTTVAAYLYRLGEKEAVAVASQKNPQSLYGADVISRLSQSLAGKKDALAAVIRQCLGELIHSLCRQAGIQPEEVVRAVLTGNTAMLYFLCGEEVSSIAAAPFASRLLWGDWREAVSLELPLAPSTPCYLPRCISAYVGADITTAILAAGYPRQGISLLVDIGTNGEMALLRGEEILCCSTAAGPAFEGAGISQGMNAAPGAIDRVWVTDGSLRCRTIGQKPAVGICGSGLIGAIAALLDCGAIDDTGLLQEEGHPLLGAMAERDGQPAIRLAGEVFLSQKDIRAVQLAKSAICAGMLALLHHAGLRMEDLDDLVIAGGFGQAIPLQSAQRIGLIPPFPVEKIRLIGNGAGMGAGMVLLSGEERQRSLRLAEQAHTLELSSDPFFRDCYIDQILFPESTLS